VQYTDIQRNTGSAISAEVKQQRKEKRAAFLQRIRDSLGTVVQQMALSPTEAALACGRSPTRGYRRVWDGTFSVVNENGRLMIPASEITRFLAGASKYDPQPKAKNGGNKNGNG
jgi:ABC-type phosphate/phosphonate transport system ATPase subunit